MNGSFSQVLIAVPILAFSIAFHEMMHALVSDRLGDDTARHMGRITLNPFAHIDPFLTIGLPLFLILLGLPPFGAARPVPISSHRLKFGDFGLALVAIAGPLTNLFLAIVSGLIFRSLPSNSSQFVVDAVALSLQINIGFFIFNLIPFPPLDGSRVLYAFAPESLQKVMNQIESTGFLAIVIFMFAIFPFLHPVMNHLNDFFLRVLI